MGVGAGVGVGVGVGVGWVSVGGRWGRGCGMVVGEDGHRCGSGNGSLGNA